MYLYGMERLGYLPAQIFGQWSIGNEFLRQWVVDNVDDLTLQLASAIDDTMHETMLEIGRQHEAKFLRDEIARLETELARLERQLGEVHGDALVDLLERVDRLRKELERLRRMLANLIVDPAAP